jgi:BirA family transcriptional regulator, biotin operon repressor / biotin---[acetyl-CoA-carboxylase] ligase
MIKHLKLAQCDSTQDELKRHFEVYQLVSTEQQNQGKGRGANSWQHYPGALAFSFKVPAHPQLTWQALEVAVSMAHSIERLWGTSVDLKWPNDIYMNGKKCGGILLQHQSPWMLIGVGLNVLPFESSDWSSILSEARSWSSEDCHHWPLELMRDYVNSTPKPAHLIAEDWNERCVHLNKIVTITDGQEITRGIFRGLGEHGEALVDDKRVFNGSLRWD